MLTQESIGKGELTTDTAQNAEQFFCKMYNTNNVSRAVPIKRE